MRKVAFLLVTIVTGCGSVAAPGGADGSVDAADGAVPDDASGPLVGDPCKAVDVCPQAGGSGTAVCWTSFPGGYCAVADCKPHGHDCPNDPGQGGTAKTTSSTCVKYGTGTACLRNCIVDGDCRPGYTCVSRDDAAGHGAVKVCLPAGDANEAGTTGGDDGGMSEEGGMNEEGGMGGGM